MNLRRIIVLSWLPASWRDRYGEEVEELLDVGGWRARDAIDVVWLGFTLRTQALRRLTVSRYAIGLLLVAAGVAGGFWSAAELTNGIGDIHEHWWSTGAVVFPVAAGIAVLLVGAARKRQLA